MDNVIEITGYVNIQNNPVTLNEFIDKFIEWVEANRWYFSGDIGWVKDGEEDEQ